MARRHRRKRPQKPQSIMGIWATALAVFSLVCCIFVTAVAATSEGNLPGWTLFIALLAMLENFFGVFLATREVKDEEKSLLFRVLGLLLTIVMSLIWIFYFVLGLFLS